MSAAASPEMSLPINGRHRHVPFLALLGTRVDIAEAGVAEVSIDMRPELLNNHGFTHGGVVMSVLDSAMAHAALSKMDYQREVVTIDMHVGFMKPGTGRLLARARTTGGGRSVCFCEAELMDAAGTVIAKCMGTFRYKAITPDEPAAA